MLTFRGFLTMALATGLALPTAVHAAPSPGTTGASPASGNAGTAPNNAPKPHLTQRGTQPPAVQGPHVRGNRTTATYNYAQAIRESVTIDAPFDSDGDGRTDRIVMDIVRPREMANNGVKAPVVMMASPYFTSLGRGPKQEKKLYDRAGNLTQFPLWYDNYFVERGYAVVALDIVGTGRSDGCSDVGGRHDIASVTAAINWLNGTGNATYLAGGHGTATANWATGSVGMIGKSYDGTVANGAAATGVPGLRTIVPINGISNWYNYTRINGINYRPRYMGYLGQIVTNNKRKCATIHQNITRATDTGLGMNDAWRERDYVKDAHAVNSSVLLVHGQHDFNVFMENAGAWHTALQRNNVPTAMYLTQADHTDPFDIDRQGWVDYLHTWFDHWLSGLPTGIMANTPHRVEHQLNTFTKDAHWPAGNLETLPLADGVVGQRPGSIATVTANRNRTSRLLADPSKQRSDRLMYVTTPVHQDVRISGESTVTMRIRTQARNLPLTVKLIDYGNGQRFRKNVSTRAQNCWGGKTSTDSACYREKRNSSRRTHYGVLGSGWLNVAYRNGLDQAQPIPRGEWFDVTIPVMASDNIVKAGNRFGIAVYTTDPDLKGNVRADAGIEIDVDSLRFNGHFVGRDALSGAATTPRPRGFTLRDTNPLHVNPNVVDAPHHN